MDYSRKKTEKNQMGDKLELSKFISSKLFSLRRDISPQTPVASYRARTLNSNPQSVRFAWGRKTDMITGNIRGTSIGERKHINKGRSHCSAGS